MELILILAGVGVIAVLLATRKKSEPPIFESPQDSPAFDVKEAIRQEAGKYGLDPAMCLALAEDESGFSPVKVNVLENAVGIFQIRPVAFQEFVNRGQNIGGWQHNQLVDAEKNITVGVWYLSWIRDTLEKSWNRPPSHREIILAFKGGIGNVLRNSVSAEAKKYADRTLAKEVKFA